MVADVEKFENVKIINCGAWSENKELESFADYADENTTLHDSKHSVGMRKEVISVKKIDDIVGDERATFIKMGIEGAELEALKGATRTIKNNKPKLAISIYHRGRDIIEIPKFIHSLVPEYRFCLRHHSFHAWETIFYAIL